MLQVIDFLKQMLSDNGQASTSRGLSWALGLTGCACVVRLIWKIPVESITLVGIAAFLGSLTAFVSAPYAINRFTQKDGGS